MFCRYCGFSLPEDSVFCSECGKSLSVPSASTSSSTTLSSPESIPDSPLSLPSERTRNKKLAAIGLIMFFLLWQLALESKVFHPGRLDIGLASSWYGVVIRIAGLIFSIKWLVNLSGYAKTSGRQAVAIFLIAFCAYGLVLVALFAGKTRLDTAAIVAGVIYVAGLFLCSLWVKKLRHGGHTNIPLADAK